VPPERQNNGTHDDEVEIERKLLEDRQSKLKVFPTNNV
jgi:hypothetical protein